ncbi:MAG: O-antigen ligase family protein [Bacteroidota bacterium]
MSIGTMLILFFWIIDPGLKGRFKKLTIENPASWMIGLYVIHLIWLFGTSDFGYAAKDLRIKLPLLVLGVSLGTIAISRIELRKVFIALGAGVTLATLVGYYLYFSDPMIKMDPRSMAPGISHIRLSLISAVLIAGVFYFWRDFDKSWRFIALGVVVNTLVFLYTLQTLTTIAVFIAGIGTLIFIKVSSIAGAKGRLVIVAPLLIIALIALVNLRKDYSNYFELSENALPLLDRSPSGNIYHHSDTSQIENGNYVFANIVPAEIVATWNERSSLKISDDPAERGVNYARLVRYLTAKGVPKDKEGVESLSPEDIENIEAGFPAPVYADKDGLSLRLHTFLHGTHLYLEKDVVAGSSFYQRFVYWSIGASIAKSNYLFGVGTGDVKTAFQEAYLDFPVRIDPKYQLRAHNQYITFLVTFGVIGLFYFLMMLKSTFKKWKANSLFTFFIVAAIISFTTEDTLETQAGVTFFAFFLSLFSAADLTHQNS